MSSVRHGAEGLIEDNRAAPMHDVRGIARRLDVCDKTVRRLIARGELHAYRIGRQLRVSELEFQKYLANTR
jgi:excisionase family DNA binding protein